MFMIAASLTEFLRLRAEICRDLLSVSRAVESQQHTCESLTRSLDQSRQELARVRTDVEAERVQMERRRAEFERREQQLLAQVEESKRANAELSKQVRALYKSYIYMTFNNILYHSHYIRVLYTLRLNSSGINLRLNSRSVNSLANLYGASSGTSANASLRAQLVGSRAIAPNRSVNSVILYK